MSNLSNPSSRFSIAKQIHTHESFLYKEHKQQLDDEDEEEEEEEEIMFGGRSSRSRRGYSRFTACFQGFTAGAQKPNYSSAGGGLSGGRKKRTSMSEKIESNINAVLKKKAMFSMRSARASSVTSFSTAERYKKVGHHYNHHGDSDAEDESLIGDGDHELEHYGTGTTSSAKVEPSVGSKLSRDNDKKKWRSSGKVFDSCRRLFFGF